MKKMLRKSMFLVALLVSLCMPSMAQQVPEEGTVYYVQNVATGLYLKYGGVWGTHVVEGRAAHPIMIEANGDGTYSLSSVAGFLNSSNLYMDQPTGTSFWTLQSAGGNNEYYLMGERNRVLASQGNVSGDLSLKVLNETDTRHKWVFKTKADILADMSKTGDKAPSKDNPIDVTPLIKASSFDLMDGTPLEIVELGDLSKPENEREPKGDIPLDGMVLNVGANPNAEDHYNGSYQSYNNYWENFGPHAKYNWHTMDRGVWGDPASYCSVGIITNDCFSEDADAHKAFTVTQSLGKLPAGTYYFSFNGFYHYYKEVITQEEYKSNSKIYNNGDPKVGERINQEMTVKVKVAGQEFTLERNASILVHGNPTVVVKGSDNKDEARYYYDFPNTGVDAALALKNAEQFKYGKQFNLSQETEFTITVSYPQTNKRVRNAPNFWLNRRTVTITQYPNWVCLDNFNLLYFGNANGSGLNMADYYNKLLTDYIADLREKIANQYPDGLSTFISGVSGVESDMDNKKIDTEPEYLEALNTIDQAYKNAINAHFQAQGKEYDCTHLIINPSFEDGPVVDGDNLDWELADGHAWDWGVKENNGGYVTNNADGYYLFNVWAGDPETNTAYIQQAIHDLAPGLYELRALVTSHPGNMVYITASDHDEYENNRNTYNTGVRAISNNLFEEATLYFLVESNGESGSQVGGVTIGAIGGNSGATGKFDYYWPWGGCYFKADHFQLKYISNLANGYLRLALHEADTTTLDVYGRTALDASLAEYKTKFENREITSIAEGKAAAAEVYGKLQDATKAQKLAGTNMTYAIYNPGFEWDNSVMFPSGWVCNTGNDTGAKMQDNGTYSVVGCTGRFVFNAWDGDKASSLTQQNLSGLVPGTYKLRVMVASANGNVLVVTVNGSTTKVTAIGATLGLFPEVECVVGNDGKLSIEVKEENGNWFKCDNFQLTLVTPTLFELDENADVIADIKDVEYPMVQVNRTINVGTNWSSFVLPFDMEIPEGWEVKEFCGGTVREFEGEDNITLEFEDAESIKAGKPYMIRTNEQDKRTSVVATDVTVNTEFEECCMNTDCNSYNVEFVGVYTKGKIPASVEGGDQYFFISGNKFYRSVTGTDNIKGFRAYFKVEANTTGAPVLRSLSMRIDDETVIETVVDAENEYVVAIYDVNGIRLSEMKPGINILRMNNGTTKKVMIK